VNSPSLLLADYDELSRCATFKYAKEVVGIVTRLVIVATTIVGSKNLQRKLSTNKVRRTKLPIVTLRPLSLSLCPYLVSK
jgi:hypothetical protein